MQHRQSSLRIGLIGAGIQASRSPAMHMTEARALGLDLVYDLFDLDRIQGGVAALPDILKALEQENYLGTNVTYPVKQTVLSLLDEYSDGVRALGACNTVVLRDGKRTGHNTDWIGFAKNFRRGLPGAPLNSVVQLGAGGAGSAVTYALLKLGAARIVIHDIETGRAQDFARRFNDLAGTERVFVSEALDKDVAVAGGVVNCTPVGMVKLPGMALPPELLRQGLWIADIVYVPLRTELLRRADAAGCRTLEGGGMAVFQAAEAFALFTGTAPDAERMLAQFQRDAEGERQAG